MPKASRFSPELQERAVRMVSEHAVEHGSQGAAIESIAAKTGCMAKTEWRRVRKGEQDAGARLGLTTAESAQINAL